MIYLFTALYCEAQIFIKRFHLERRKESSSDTSPVSTRFQQFYNEKAGICLTITEVGEIAAAAAVSAVCTAWQPYMEMPGLCSGLGKTMLSSDDSIQRAVPECMLVNIGLCAHTSGEKGIFLCNKIIEQATGKTFYPDILYRHPFREESLMTGIRPLNDGEVSRPLCNPDKTPPLRTAMQREVSEKTPPAAALYDMEGAAIYQAGSYFFGPHQMIFLKVVSDEGDAGAVSKEQALHLMENNQDVLFDFIVKLQRLVSHGERSSRRQEYDGLVRKLAEDLHCSKAMRDALAQHMHYLELAGTDYPSVIREMYREGVLPCKDKREGKLCFEELKRRLF